MTVLKVCITPRCGQLTTGSRCPRCQSVKDRTRNQASYYQTPAWRALAQACVERDGNCLVCSSTTRMTANHIIGRADDGPDDVENLMTMCGRCHSTFEADTRYGRSTELRRAVDEIRVALISQRGLRPQGEPSA
jgi:5-methylcytosine-specific restriction endonuclease McrA